MPAGSPLTHARWIAADSCPLAAAIPSPVDRVHTSRPGVPCVCLVVPTGTFYIIMSVLSTETRLGQAAPLVVAMEAILAACPLVVEVEVVPVGCPVLFCVSSPGGLLLPPDFPREIFLGGKRGSGCRGWAEGTEAKAPEDHPPWPPELPAPPWPPELPAPPWPPELPAPPWPPSSVPLWRSPSCVPIRVCPEGPPEHPPLLYVRVLLCVSSVPASCVHIWFVSCPC